MQDVAQNVKDLWHMALIHQKISALLADMNLSNRQAALKCGIPYGTFNSALKNEREIGWSTLDALSRGLGVSFRYFSSDTAGLELLPDRQPGGPGSKAFEILNAQMQAATRTRQYSGCDVSLQDFLDWWFSNSGRLEGFDQLQHTVDMFDPPDPEKNRIQPIQSGPHSLASVCFEVSSSGQLRDTLNGFSDKVNADLVMAHSEAINRGEPVITHPSLDVKLLNGRRFTRQYRRVLAPVYLPDGKLLVANFSQDIKFG
ncbi:helix-turn-helix domain-containing protein [Leisingera caerulea]|uniref:Helix-turn-helix domain-containing protein n=1 Tax=Leisingera caerulea TaxID=506591 RepID=A0A9Q9HMX5_LEICA|nr:helix-turn-helix domain-containing protein [Leisingera caerulea]UWQ55185.1 helix-turn-helix domain-containing protein [Leisingera caerulea]UWQ59800.1 helix-turn-helix domain-containing protein [Leisingera caerulea]